MILENRSKEGSSTYIAYTLKNGKKIVRYYDLDTNLYASALGPIYESKEYKDGRFPVLHQEADDIKYIQVHDYSKNKQPIVISDKESLKTLLLKSGRILTVLIMNSLLPLPKINSG
jgi:ABC-2 type transport system permease protein